MSNDEQTTLLHKLQRLDQMPSIPVVVAPLLRYLEQPLDHLDTQKVVEMISQDKSLAAQCLRMANSPLFGRWQAVESVRDAVIALGMQRMRDIVFSCSILTLVPGDRTQIDPTVFWEHAMGCALVCRHFARRIAYPDPGKAYLAGLLHDIGVIAHLWLLPGEFRATLELARAKRIPLHEAELDTLGITHCESGKLVAERWALPADMIEVVGFHHDLEHAKDHWALLALVSLADLLCRMGGIGYGYPEERQVSLMEEPAFEILLQQCPTLKDFDWARLTFELEAYLDEVHRLVTLLYRPQ